MSGGVVLTLLELLRLLHIPEKVTSLQIQPCTYLRIDKDRNLNCSPIFALMCKSGQITSSSYANRPWATLKIENSMMLNMVLFVGLDINHIVLLLNS